MQKRRRTHFESEHADKRGGDSGPGFDDKLEIAYDSRGAEGEEGLTAGFVAMLGGEVGVLVCKDTTDCFMDVV